MFSFTSLGSEGVYFVPAFNGLQVKLYCHVTSLIYLICTLSEAWYYMLVILCLVSTIRVPPSCQSGNTFKFFNVENLQFLDPNILIGFVLQDLLILSIKFCKLVILEHLWLAGPAFSCMCCP